MTIRLEPSGPARCSGCRHHRHVWDPQPGVNWDRCGALPSLPSCARNTDNTCPDFKRSLRAKLGLPLPAFKWWAPYL